MDDEAVPGAKRPLIALTVLIVLLAVIVGFGFIQSGKTPTRWHRQTDTFSFGGIDWTYQDFSWRQAEGKYAYDVILVPVSGAGHIKFTPEYGQNICGAILGKLPAIAPVHDRRAIFRVSVRLVSQDRSLFPDVPLPIAVIDGSCKSLASGSAVLPGYPGLMPDWVAQTWTANDQTLTGLRVRFVGFDRPDLDSFDPAVACRAALFDVLPALVAADPANEQHVAALREIEIEATTVGTVMGVELGRYRVWSIPISPQGCGAPRETGI